MAVVGWFMEACESCFKPEDDPSPAAEVEVEEEAAPAVSEVEPLDSLYPLRATGRTVACRDDETTRAIDDLSFWGRFRNSEGLSDSDAGLAEYMRLLEQGECTVIPEGEGRVRVTQPNPESGRSEAEVEGEAGRWIIIDRMFERAQ